MANICTNELRAYSKDPANLICINNLCFYYFSVTFTYEDNNELHVIFNSKCDFPESTMNKIFESLPNKESINMVCLSTEWGNYYSAFHVCDSKGWRLE